MLLVDVYHLLTFLEMSYTSRSKHDLDACFCHLDCMLRSESVDNWIGKWFVLIPLFTWGGFPALVYPRWWIGCRIPSSRNLVWNRQRAAADYKSTTPSSVQHEAEELCRRSMMSIYNASVFLYRTRSCKHILMLKEGCWNCGDPLRLGGIRLVLTIFTRYSAMLEICLYDSGSLLSRTNSLFTVIDLTRCNRFGRAA